MLSSRARKSAGLATVAMVVAVASCTEASPGQQLEEDQSRNCVSIGDRPVQIGGGTFEMGTGALYPEERPIRTTTVSTFWMERHEVTNRQFARFVAETGYVTDAERPVDPDLFGVPLEDIPPEMLEPGSAVFSSPSFASRDYRDWWQYLPGASWRKPHGPEGSPARANEPVVHLTLADMLAYAEWKGGRLPTEAEWEFAARDEGQYRNLQPDPDEANTWQGMFPLENKALDGHDRIAPVGCFEPNSQGLYDMIGNVWEMTADYYTPGRDAHAVENPKGPLVGQARDPLNPGFASRVMKGGSFLCAPNYCQRYRPAARQGRDPGMGTSNVGFRLVFDNFPG